MAQQTPEELIARCICPVKQEYLRREPLKREAAATESKPSKGKKRQVTLGCLANGCSNVAFTAHDQHGSMHAPSVLVACMQENRKDAQASMCFNFVLGRCERGNGCKFTHDVEAYLKTRQPDLPGRCPFTASGSCAYGISCRWACSHTFTNPMHDRLRAYHAQQQQEQQQEADPAPAGFPEAGEENGSSSAAPPPPAAAQAGPVKVEELPVGESIEKCINVMDKGVQNQLWKNR
jgi:hypothetical protein